MMTLREAMETLNGELNKDGSPAESSKALRMERMQSRLASLEQEYKDAVAFGWGEGIPGQIRSDIWWQRRAIEQAGR